MTEDAAPGPQARTSLGQLAALFAKLGFTSFGGPAAHVALMQQEVVDRRKWVDGEHFMDMVSAVNFIPGPNATELAIHVGQLRAGFRGLVVAGACFIVPSMLISTFLAWVYVRWGTLPSALPTLRAIGAAIVAIVAWATYRFGRTALKGVFSIVVAVCAALASVAGSLYLRIQPEIPVLLAAAIIGGVRTRGGNRGARTLAFALPALLWTDVGRMALGFLKIGATLFGSGYVLVSYFQSELVDRHGWLTQQQLADTIAVGQFTPGPLLSSGTFAGYLLGSLRFGGGEIGGLIGAAAATLAIFLPSFVLVAAFGPMLQRIRGLAWARGALDSMNAAVVGLMVIAAVRLGSSALLVPGSARPDLVNDFLFVGALAGLTFKINSTWLILLAAGIGTLRSFLGG